jgi:single-strand DNA-binding protein
MNKAILLGNISKDVELKTTPSGKNVATCSMATNKKYTDTQGQKQEQVQFHNLVIWGKPADIFAQYVSKGSKIAIEGEIQTRNYTAQDGTKRYITEILVKEFYFLSSNKNANQNNGQAHMENSQEVSGPIPF